jgi:hypothetical protein
MFLKQQVDDLAGDEVPLVIRHMPARSANAPTPIAAPSTQDGVGHSDGKVLELQLRGLRTPVPAELVGDLVGSLGFRGGGAHNHTGSRPRGTSPRRSSRIYRQRLAPAAVFRTVEFDAQLVRNRAKFLVIDHRFLLVTSANFSHRGTEQHRVRFEIDTPSLAEPTERKSVML